MDSFKEASYSGGVNITFKGILKDSKDFTTRLFQGNLVLGELPLYITHSVSYLLLLYMFQFQFRFYSKINAYNCNAGKIRWVSQLGVALEFSSNLHERASVLIAPSGANQLLVK